DRSTIGVAEIEQEGDETGELRMGAQEARHGALDAFFSTLLSTVRDLRREVAHGLLRKPVVQAVGPGGVPLCERLTQIGEIGLGDVEPGIQLERLLPVAAGAVFVSEA